MTGIDGTVEILAELDRLSSGSEVARDAPRGKDLYRYLAGGMRQGETLGVVSAPEFAVLTEHLITRLGIWWSPAAYGRMPVATPWCVRDRSCRYDQGPEMWGSPRNDGYLRDDNSIIKKLPLPVTVAAGHGHPYEGRKPWRGFTACHIWRDLPDGSVAGEDPWLYSFLPNLVWLPSWLAPLTDRHLSHIQTLLQRTSIALFGNAIVHTAVAKYAQYAWGRLIAPTPGRTLELNDLAFFDPNPAFFTRRVNYLGKFVTGCDEVLTSGHLKKKLICSRYTVGLPDVSPDALAAFALAIRDYRDSALSSTAA